jgi:hypothetical protein
MKPLFGDIVRHHPSCGGLPSWRSPPFGLGLEFWMTHRSDHPGCFKEKACQKSPLARRKPSGTRPATVPRSRPSKPQLMQKPGLWLVFPSFRDPARLPPSKTIPKDETASPPVREQTNPDSRIPRDVMGCTVKKGELRAKLSPAAPDKVCGFGLERPGRSSGSGGLRQKTFRPPGNPVPARLSQPTPVSGAWRLKNAAAWLPQSPFRPPHRR